jgi:hypothetical protein
MAETAISSGRAVVIDWHDPDVLAAPVTKWLRSAPQPCASIITHTWLSVILGFTPKLISGSDKPAITATPTYQPRNDYPRNDNRFAPQQGH